MNKKIQELINNNIREYLDRSIKLILNEPRLNSGNTLEHELKKCEICFKLKGDGFTFVSEHPLKSGGRPDILILDVSPPIAYEIMNSEKEENLLKKQPYYRDIRIIGVRI